MIGAGPRPVAAEDGGPHHQPGPRQPRETRTGKQPPAAMCRYSRYSVDIVDIV